MGKVCLITIHWGANFGSILQTIATSELFKQLGHQTVVLNYIQNRWTWKYYWKEALASPLRLGRRILFALNRKVNIDIYQGYLEKHCVVTKPVYNDTDVLRMNIDADYYVTGSDQVWNTKHNLGVDKRYFLDWVPEDKTKFSYASSIGLTELPIIIYDEYKHFLAPFSGISVRESFAKKIIESMGYDVTQLVDPTFMLTKDDWKKFMTPRTVNHKYILLYLPYNTMNKTMICDMARKVADEKDLIIVSFSWDYFYDKYADKTIRYANPGDFLTLMNNAEYVITNSFHGTAFSINLNKSFAVYMPSAFGSRIESILSLFDLSDRLVTEKSDSLPFDKPIDYCNVNNILVSERKKTINYLQNVFRK